MSTGLVDQALNYVADKIVSPITNRGSVSYNELTATNGWAATHTGVLVVTYSPSNTGNSYAYIDDQTDNVAICRLCGTGGLSQGSSFPVIKGHKYKLTAASTNAQNRVGGVLYEFLGKAT